MDSKDFTPEQIEKARACKAPEELLALAMEEGIELTDDQLQHISGGGTWDLVTRDPFAGCCPNCFSNKIMLIEMDGGGTGFRCRECFSEFV